jgi:hypothetical protein
MKLPITIQYSTGEEATFIASPPEWMKWERSSGHTISQAQDKIGVADLLFLAYHAMKREAAGKPVKPFEAWAEGVSDITVGDSSPKATTSEV